MLWVLVFGAIALAGLAMVICFGIWLWRKSLVLLDEVAILLGRADELVGLLDQIEVPSDAGVPARYPGTSGEEGAEDDDAERGRLGEERRRMADDPVIGSVHR
ncbi:MAG TPA: hypothetical protein VIT41_11490 [Microlunatus sp.]